MQPGMQTYYCQYINQILCKQRPPQFHLKCIREVGCFSQIVRDLVWHHVPFVSYLLLFYRRYRTIQIVLSEGNWFSSLRSAAAAFYFRTYCLSVHRLKFNVQLAETSLNKVSIVSEQSSSILWNIGLWNTDDTSWQYHLVGRRTSLLGELGRLLLWLIVSYS